MTYTDIHDIYRLYHQFDERLEEIRKDYGDIKVEALSITFDEYVKMREYLQYRSALIPSICDPAAYKIDSSSLVYQSAKGPIKLLVLENGVLMQGEKLAKRLGGPSNED